MAIMRVYNAALNAAGISAHVDQVIEDKKRGLVAQVSCAAAVDDAALNTALGAFIQPWERAV
jgi:hypothetical protein